MNAEINLYMYFSFSTVVKNMRRDLFRRNITVFFVTMYLYSWLLSQTQIFVRMSHDLGEHWRILELHAQIIFWVQFIYLLTYLSINILRLYTI